MNAKARIVPVLCIALLLGLTAGLGAAVQESQEVGNIPKEVKADIQEGLASRQGRQDIRGSIFMSYFFPARDNSFHSVFFLKIMNSDLGYAPAPASAVEPKGAENGPQEIPAQEVAADLEASFNVFIQCNRLDNNGVPQPIREIYVPAKIRVPAAELDLEKEDLYSVGVPLTPGDYVVAIALTSLDLQQVGIAYYELSLPDPATFAKSLETTQIFFVKQMERMEAGAEQYITFHRDCFTYSYLKVVPNIDRVFSAGENLDIFFFVLGAQPNAAAENEIEINFEVKKDEEMQIKFTPQAYDSFVISQPLPMKQTVKIKKGEEERIEQRDLPAGSYTLVIDVLDKISKKTTVKTIDFEVK